MTLRGFTTLVGWIWIVAAALAAHLDRYPAATTFGVIAIFFLLAAREERL